MEEENRRLRILTAGLVMVIFIGVAVQSVTFILDAKRDERIAEIGSDNRQLLDRYKPCIPADDQQSPQCVRDREVARLVQNVQTEISRRVVADVAIQHGDVQAQHAALEKSVRELREILLRELRAQEDRARQSFNPPPSTPVTTVSSPPVPPSPQPPLPADLLPTLLALLDLHNKGKP